MFFRLQPFFPPPFFRMRDCFVKCCYSYRAELKVNRERF